jgi:hypothetical protein
MVRLNSKDCPGLGAAIEAIESRRLDWRVDLLGVGTDQKLADLQPHAEWVSYTMSLITPDGGRARLEGRGGALARLVEPVLAAADQCEAEAPSG